jgi:PAS domain S-box-containing protein
VEPESYPTEIGLREDPGGVLALADSLSAFVALLHEHEISYVNPAACALLGRPKEALLGRSLCEFVHPDDLESLEVRGGCWQAGSSAPLRVADRFVNADGATVWLEYSIDSIRLGGR